MTPFQILFAFDGRLARLAYLRYSAMAGIVLLLAIVPTYFLLLAFKPLGMAAVVVIVVAALWMTVALTVKRLHDIGLPGAHAAWILVLDLATIGSSQVNVAIGMVVFAAAFLAGLWLLLMPGERDDNAYGLAY
jgi:uncharacterized membrane protein YhaH (DUF805 family)